MADGPWRGIDNLEADFAMPRKFMRGPSPAHARLLDLLEAGLDGYRERLAEVWAEREFSARYERPLMLLASLRWQALGEGPDHPLWAGIGADTPDPGALTADRLEAALSPDRQALWTALRERFVQTNETSRAVAWLWPASWLPAGCRVELFDLGASAGLNLLGDGLPRPWIDDARDVALLQETPRLDVVGRTAFDANPLDASDPDSARWLRACVWPEQRARLERLDAALQLASQVPLDLRRADAAQMPASIEPAHEDSRLIAYQSILRDYLDEHAREALREGMHTLLRRHAPGRMLWMTLEQEGRDAPPEWSSALTAHVADGRGEVQALCLARTHPHPSRLRVDAEAVAALRALLGG